MLPVIEWGVSVCASALAYARVEATASNVCILFMPILIPEFVERCRSCVRSDAGVSAEGVFVFGGLVIRRKHQCHYGSAGVFVRGRCVVLRVVRCAAGVRLRSGRRIESSQQVRAHGCFSYARPNRTSSKSMALMPTNGTINPETP